MRHTAGSKLSPKRHQAGAAMIEYAIVLAFIALTGVTAIKVVGQRVNGKAEHIQSRMVAASGGVCRPDLEECD